MITDHSHHFFLVSDGRLMDLVRWELLNQIEAGGGTLSCFVPIMGVTSRNPVFVLVCIEGINDESIVKKVLGNCALLRWVYQSPHVYCGYGMEPMLSRYGDEVAEIRIVGRRKRPKFRHDNNNDPPFHILADYRGLSTSQEEQAMCFVCLFFCDGGDQFCRTMGLETQTVQTSISAHATTRMDFTRSYLTVTAARIRKGMIVLDPFVGSGAILQVARSMGASILLGNDLIPNNCRLCDRHSSCEILTVVASIHHAPWTNVVDCIVTDPPYGIRTKSLSSVENAPTSILIDLLHCADRVLVENGRLVFWWSGLDGTSVLRFMEELLGTCGLDRRLQLLTVAGDELGLGKSTINDDMGGAPEEDEQEEEDNNDDDDDEQQEMGTCCDIDDDSMKKDQCPKPMLRKTRSHQSRKTLLQCRWQRCLVVMVKGDNNTRTSISPVNLLPTIFSSSSSPSNFVLRKSADDVVSEEVIENHAVLTGTGGTHIPKKNSTWNVTILDQLFTAARRGDTATLDRIATDLCGIFGSSLTRCPSSSCPRIPSCTFPNDKEESIWDIADAHDCRLLMYVLHSIFYIERKGGSCLIMHFFLCCLYDSCAAGFGKSNVIHWLLQHGANVNIIGCGKTSGSALIRASRFGHVHCVRILLEAGADPCEVDNKGLTALAHALAFDHFTVVECFVATARAIQREQELHDDVMKILQPYLFSSTKDSNQNATTTTALHITAQWGSVRCMNYLLMYNTTDVNVALADGTTPLHVASRWGHKECVTILLNKGGHANQRDNMGNSPIELASMWGRTTCISLLTSKNIEDMNT